jgi:Mrp family chromosome partitioning ATPase
VPDPLELSQPATQLDTAVSFLRRRLLPALFAGLVIASITIVVRQALPSSFTAETSLLLAAPQQGLESVGVVTPPMIDPGVYRTAILEGGVLSRVLTQLGRPADTAAQLELAERVRVSVDNQLISSVIRIRVTSSEAQDAAVIANLIARSIIQWDADRARQALSTNVTALQVSLAQVERQLAAAGGEDDVAALELREGELAAELAAARARAGSLAVAPLLEVLHEAVPPREPDGSGSLLLPLLAFLLGTGAVLAAGWLATMLREGVQQAGELERHAGLPVLATFPAASARGVQQIRRDAADIVRDRLSAGRPEGPAVIVVTSPQHSAEKNGVAAALAESFGRSGQQTLLLDANLREPASGEEFRLNEGEFVSLEQYLTDPGRRLEFISIRLEGRRVFSLIPSFTPAAWPADLLRDSLGNLLGQWQRRFSVIVIDAAPLLPYPDSGGIIRHADTVVLATRLGLTRPGELQQAARILAGQHGKVPRLVTSEADSLFAGGSSRVTDDYAISILRAPREPGRSESRGEFTH